MTFITVQDLFWLAGLGALVGWWWHAKGIRDRALVHVRQHCRRQEVLLLDGGLALRGYRPMRDAGGRLRMQRTYVFEFTATGDDRNRGWVTLLGSRLSDIQLGVHRI